MSIVTNLMGKLHFISAMQSRGISFGSMVSKISVSTPHFRFLFRHEWSSTKEERDFDTALIPKRAYTEAQAKMPVVR